MKEEKSIALQLVKKLIHKAVRAEAAEWPPITPCGMYQPSRPTRNLLSEKK